MKAASLADLSREGLVELLPAFLVGACSSGLTEKARKRPRLFRKGRAILRLAVFGLGYVGSVSSACLAALGHEILGVDVNAQKVAQVNDGTVRTAFVSPHHFAGHSSWMTQQKRAGQGRPASQQTSA